MSDLTESEVGALLTPEHWQGRVFDGTWTPLSATSDVVEPATGRHLGAVGLANAADIGRSAAVARKSQEAWFDAPYETRAGVLRDAARVAAAHSREIVDLLVREAGSIGPKAQFEVGTTIKALVEAGAMPSQASGQVLPSERGRISLARRRPIGVVGVISPFNFPLYLAMRAVAPALAVGNAVVLKPDPRTAVCGGFTIARIFELAGLPAGVLHVLPGGAEAGEALCSDPNVGMIQFTGSTGAGRKVGEIAGRHLKKLSLELGGKNALIVLEDADLDLAVANAAWGAYLHQGQICMASGRILVHASIAEAFSRKLTEKARAMPVGDPSGGQVALGPLISQGQVDRAQRIIDETVRAGAVLTAGGPAEGLFFKASVLTGVTPGMAAFEEEIFAPVAVVTTFQTDEEAVALTNSDFGLSAAILTNSIERALAIGDRLKTGIVHINDQTVNDDVINPFGGSGASGNGTSIGGPANWEEFTQWQWVTMKGTPPRYPF